LFFLSFSSVLGESDSAIGKPDFYDLNSSICCIVALD
jgi:hypothetical protein